MKTLTEQLSECTKNGQLALMTHVVAGFPSLDESEELITFMDRAGVAFIEIQIPFSDPIADGPAIMHANDSALSHGVTTANVFELIGSLRSKVTAPLLIMGYYQTVFHFGVEKFCQQCERVGVTGLIIPDLPIDEEPHELFLAACKRHGISAIRVLSPTSSQQRIALNVAEATGFIYCTAVAGITGVRHSLSKDSTRFIKKMREYTTLPLAVGFGISHPSHLQRLKGVADIGVVGSAVISALQTGGMTEAKKLIKELCSAV